MLKLSDLAVRQDFTLGVLRVSPSRREIVGPVGVVHIEPLVMQVFLLLADAKGEVVTRKRIFDEIWGGSEVGDYSLNRTITMIRRIAAEVAPGAFEIENIPRTGYRLLVNAQPGRHDAPKRRNWWRPSLVTATLALVAVAAVLSWNWLDRRAFPIVAVMATDEPRSQALSRDLFVKFGTLANVGPSKWQLADPEAGSSDPDLVFRVTDTGSSARPQASLVLLDGQRDIALWSREFTHSTESGVREQLSLTAARVLGCTLEAREASELSLDLLKQFLGGCAEATEISPNEPHKIARIMRTIVNQQPRFAPAWAQLLLAQSNLVARAETSGSGVPEARTALAHDIAKARRIAANIPEIELAEIELLSPYDYAGALQRVADAKAKAPDKADVWLFEVWPLMRVGRMSDAIQSAKRAAELDPLSPATTRELIIALAHGSRIELAKEELQRAEHRWAGSDAIRDARWAFHLRYGDPRIAMAMSPEPTFTEPFLRARIDPTAENVNALVSLIQREGPDAGLGAIQDLGVYHKTDEAFDWLGYFPPSTVAKHSYVLFRPALADIRRDPRFMTVAKRTGLLRYWRESGKWPDFCFEPDLPYDCKDEAAKLAA